MESVCPIWWYSILKVPGASHLVGNDEIAEAKFVSQALGWIWSPIDSKKNSSPQAAAS